MHSQAGKSVKIIDGEIAIAHRIETVGRNVRKAEFLCQRSPIHGERTAAQGARAQWARIRRVSRGAEPLKITKECLGMP